MKQCLFDELVLFVLETISSEEYLNSIGIYRPPVTKYNWLNFVKSVNNQTIEPGIYARRMGGGSVHYYAVRKSKSYKTVGNGYPYLEEDKNKTINDMYSHPLDAQPVLSHGLCQTFALMYYLNEEERLMKGNENDSIYFGNVIIGFQFLLEFVETKPYERELEWSMKSMLENMTLVCDDHSKNERLMNLNMLGKRITLSKLIKTILDPRYRENLRLWFYNDKEVEH